MSVKYLDLVGGSDAADGLTAATPKKTFSAASALMANGDTLKCKASPAPTALNGNPQATWTDLSKAVAVTWSTQLVKDIDRCAIAWTAGAAASASVLGTTLYKKTGQNSTVQITALNNTTGLLGYHALGGTIDFSAYRLVSFWVRTSVPQGGVNPMSLRLCSDALGVTAVNTIPIPALTASGRWTLVTVDTGGALGNNIQSIALYADTGLSVSNILLDNIIACVAGTDNLTLTSLIGKGTAGETYYGIQSIGSISGAGCTIYLDNQTETLGSAGQGYAAQTVGLNETGTLWKREPITLTQMGQGLLASGSLIAPGAGVGGSVRTYDFGYSDLTLGAADSETWIDHQNGVGDGVFMSAKSFITMRGLGVVRAGDGMSLGSACRALDMRMAGMNNLTNCPFALSAGTGGVQNSLLSSSSLNNNGTFALLFGFGGNTFYAGQINNNLAAGIGLSSGDNFNGKLGGGSTVMRNNVNGAVNIVGSGTGSRINNIVSSSNTNAAITASGGAASARARGIPNASFRNCTLNEAIVANMSNSLMVSIKDFNGTAGDNRIYTDGALITSVADANRDTLSGLAWKCNFTDATRNQYYPVELLLGSVAVVANRPVIISARMKRDNADTVGGLLVPGLQLTGVDNDVSAVTAGTLNTYETITLATITPTETGFLDVYWQVYGGSGHNCWIDNVAVIGLDTVANLNGLDSPRRGVPVIANAESAYVPFVGSVFLPTFGGQR